MTDLATRYGTPSTARRRSTVAVAAVLAAAFLGWVVWAAVGHSDPDVTSELVSFEVLDEHTVTATFTVARRTTDVSASCLLRAQAPDHSTVGELNVDVGPGGERVQQLTERVRTEREATTVDLIGCRTGEQSRRR
ncbi:DUF4307 domain-containing protein [Nocardioides pakistanensis]